VKHSQLLREQAQLKNNIQILLNEKRKLLVEQTELPASSVEAKRLCEEARMNICDPSAKQQQVGLGLRVRLSSCLTINIDNQCSCLLRDLCPDLGLIQVFIYVMVYKAFCGDSPSSRNCVFGKQMLLLFENLQFIKGDRLITQHSTTCHMCGGCYVGAPL